MRAPSEVRASRGGAAQVVIGLEVLEGYHVNSHTPADPYLIPLRLTWKPGPAEPVEILYPEPKLEKFAFAAKPVSVFTGKFAITTRFRIPATAPLGPAALSGRLRYQACTDSTCLPPRTAEVRVPLNIQP
ncbi:MAG: protein-disulfide reductase DsbD family protein [Bryobacterales bacterium]|nr:protein-disulfide reductase DsbD N-terminal domain-containing protein [Bryobacteraceae bacterium]MDW8353423.1 protein-disulfide reductase DsbD family protein [Bryobacterales bacterium]